MLEIDFIMQLLEIPYEVNQHDNIDVIVSHTVADGASQKSSKRALKSTKTSAAELRALENQLKQVEARNDHFEKLVISKLDELNSATSSISARPLAERENKLQSVKVQGEINSLGDEISKMWKVIGELEGKKSLSGPSDDPSSFGELAKAINAQMAAGNTATTSGPRNVFCYSFVIRSLCTHR